MAARELFLVRDETSGESVVMIIISAELKIIGSAFSTTPNLKKESIEGYCVPGKTGGFLSSEEIEEF